MIRFKNVPILYCIFFRILCIKNSLVSHRKSHIQRVQQCFVAEQLNFSPVEKVSSFPCLGQSWTGAGWGKLRLWFPTSRDMTLAKWGLLLHMPAYIHTLLIFVTCILQNTYFAIILATFKKGPSHIQQISISVAYHRILPSLRGLLLVLPSHSEHIFRIDACSTFHKKKKTQIVPKLLQMFSIKQFNLKKKLSRIYRSFWPFFVCYW